MLMPGKRDRDAPPPCEETQPLEDLRNPSWPGDERYPVSLEVLDRYCVTHSACGLAGFSDQQRRANVHRICVRDRGDVKDETQYMLQLSCSELHPGLCATDDQDVYADAIQLAKSFEHCISRDFLYQFILVTDKIYVAGHPPGRAFMYYVARIRARKPTRQMTHVLVQFRKSGSQYKPAQRGTDLREYTNLWVIAKTILRQAWPEVWVYIVPHRSRDDGSVSFHRELVESGMP